MMHGQKYIISYPFVVNFFYFY